MSAKTEDHHHPFELRPLCDALGAEIAGVDLARGITEPLFTAIYDAFLAYEVLLFRDQDLPPARQVELARHFGEVPSCAAWKSRWERRPPLRSSCASCARARVRGGLPR